MKEKEVDIQPIMPDPRDEGFLRLAREGARALEACALPPEALQPPEFPSQVEAERRQREFLAALRRRLGMPGEEGE